MIVRRSSSPQRNTKFFYCLWPTRGMYLHIAKSTRRYGEIFPPVARATLSAFTSATCGKSCTRQLPMLPLPSDLSGCCSSFSAVNLSYSGKFTFSCHHARCHLLPKRRSCPLAADGIFTRSQFPDLKKQAALSASGTVPLLSDKKPCFFQVLDCSSHSRL